MSRYLPDSNALQRPVPTQSLLVYQAAEFVVRNGANLGDQIAEGDRLELDDIYALKMNAKRVCLNISSNGTGQTFAVLADGEAGCAGALLHLDCCATFISDDGTTVDVIILVETKDNIILATYFLPLAPLKARRSYALVKVDRENVSARFSERAVVSFTRGTHITLANAKLAKIEDLKVGDSVLTRKNGVQEIRWIGQKTARTTGEFAPVLIAKGALNNENDLILGPNHCLFIYRQHDQINSERAELKVKAHLLVDGKTVKQADAGFVDYFQLRFDRPEIIFAEGIAVESHCACAQSPVPDTVPAIRAQRQTGKKSLAGHAIGKKMLNDQSALESLHQATGR